MRSSEEPKEVTSPSLGSTSWYDSYKLATAVAMHETHMGLDGVGQTYNNVCGIRRRGTWEHYVSIEAGLADCQSVLEQVYYGQSIIQIAQHWTTTSRDAWVSNVTYFYEK